MNGTPTAPAPVAPEPVDNRPALSAIAYRIGTYASFREAMLERLASTPELSRLTTRDGDDYAITLLELWAAVADVLTFYEERYANEAFLRTATERDSVSRLTALIGYRIGPGAAAGTLLSFEVQDGKSLTIPTGFRVQTVPGPGQQAQTFETLADLAADSRFNRLRAYPPSSVVSAFAAGTTEVVLDRERGPELAAGLAVGARVLLFAAGAGGVVETKRVASVRNEDDRVVVAWTEPVQRAWASGASAYPAGRTFRIAGHDAAPTYMTPVVPVSSPRILTLGLRTPAPPSGNVTWQLTTLTDADYTYTFGVGSGATTIQLDAVYQGLAAGQLLLVETTGASPSAVVVRVNDARTAPVTFGMATATVSILDVDVVSPAPVAGRPWTGDRRQVVVHELVGDVLAPWDESYPDTFAPGTVCIPGRFVGTATDPAIEIGRTVSRGALAPGVVVRPAELEPGRLLFVGDGAGTPAEASIAAPATIDTPDEEGFCHLRLTLELVDPPTLETASAYLLGNVVRASHGETVPGEVLGNGDASQAFQSFTLKKQPLTYLAGSDSPEPQPSLEVRVDDVRWTEVTTLFGRGAAERVYEVDTNEDGSSSIRFGDGTSGARPSTGNANVAATYRFGSGLAGQVGAGTLTTALQRPPGFIGATNPLAAHGGADPDDVDAARVDAPRTVVTFDRAVSLTDFEELAMASGAAAKAQAIWIWSGFERVVYVTVAGSGGVQLDDEDLRTLAAGLTAVRDPNHRLVVANYQPVPVVVAATIGVDPAYKADAVQAAARAALLDSLSFDQLSLGTSLHLADVYATLQNVSGVVWVDVNRFRLRVLALARTRFVRPGLLPPPVESDVIVAGARYDPTTRTAHPAELATVLAPTTDVVVTVDAGGGG